MTLIIADDILQAAQLSADELRHEIAVLLFQQERLTLAQAARFADLDRLAFQRLLSSRQIALHYTPDDLNDDLAVVRESARS